MYIENMLYVGEYNMGDNSYEHADCVQYVGEYTMCDNTYGLSYLIL